MDKDSFFRSRRLSKRPIGIRSLPCRLAELAGLCLLVILAGCVATPTPQVSGAPHLVKQKELLNGDIAADLISTLPQLLEPLSTTLQFNNPDSGDVLPIVKRLVELGYGVQKVDSDQGSYFLRLDDLSTANDIKKQVTILRLAVGDLEFQRSYKVLKTNPSLEDQGDFLWRQGFAVVPVSPLAVSGTRVELDLAGFQLAKPDVQDSREIVPSSVVYAEETPIEGGIPTISFITEDLVKRVADTASGGTNYQKLYTDSFTLENMTHIDDGAFASISDNYNRITREIVVFPNDSDFLGRPGKVQIKKVLDRFSKSSDIFGIIGCSTGKTTLAIGNEGLALGRATRVADELFTAGVARDKVFNEGCWSTDINERGLPNRGVVVDLWRRKS